MKYKVGDKVRIRSDLIVGEKYGKLDFLSDMAKLKGQEVIINHVSKSGNYYIEEIGYYYAEEMFEDVEEREKENENEPVYLVAGIINGTTQVLYWKCNISLIYNIGDYAIVENKQGYDLIKIVGDVVTERNNTRFFSKTKYENMKKVIKIVYEDELEEE